MKPRPFLEQFHREWKYHNPISDQQLDSAGAVDTVKDVGFYPGGFCCTLFYGVTKNGSSIVSDLIAAIIKIRLVIFIFLAKGRCETQGSTP